MKEIDFLPAEMLRQGALRSQRQWQILAASMVVAVLVGSFGYQTYCRRQLTRQLAAISAEYKTARAQHQQLKHLRVAAGQYREAAGLYALLQHPWPRTQLLAALVAPLTEEIQLTSVRIAAPATSRTAPSPAVSATQLATPESPSNMPAARRDWQQLWDEARQRPAVMEISGTTADAAALHQVVTQLTGSSLFASSRLVSLTSVEGSDDLLRFTLILELNPPPGVPRETPPPRIAAREGRSAQ